MQIRDVLLALASVVALAHAGCATLEHNRPKDAEDRLRAAGFTARLADSPQSIASIASMPPHKLVSQTKDDHFVYFYADPDYCHCVYEGGPEEYSAYQRILFQETLAEERPVAHDWP